jgi:hypothetical protein
VVRKKNSFEVRKNDRNFRVGDTLILEEWLPNLGKYSGDSLKVKIEYLLQGGVFGIEKDYCVIGFNPENITLMS